MDWVGWLRAKAGELETVRDTPHARAMGLAVGVFFGFVPLVGLKTLLALGVTRLLRGNLLAAVIAVTLHDLLLPVAPLLLRWEYDLGSWLTSHPHQFPPTWHSSLEHPAMWLHWSTFLTVGRPLLIGSVILAMPASLATYFLGLRWPGRDHQRGSASRRSGPGVD